MKNELYKEHLYYIREIAIDSNSELELVTKNCMQTVLETIPEFDNNPEKVKREFKNFSFEDMKLMIKNDLGKKDHKLLVAVNNKEEIIGQSIFSVKTDIENIKYGFCFSRYVSPLYRKKGIGIKLLELAEEWWIENKAVYAVAQTHIENHKLKSLFMKMNYETSEAKQNNVYKYYELKKYLIN